MPCFRNSKSAPRYRPKRRLVLRPKAFDYAALSAINILHIKMAQKPHRFAFIGLIVCFFRMMRQVRYTE